MEECKIFLPFRRYIRYSFPLMAKNVSIGAKGTAEERVQFEHTLASHHHSMPPIFSSAELVRLIDAAGQYALQPFCEQGEISVCTALQVEHRVPVGMNAAVRATAEVESVDGRFCRLHVAAFEGKTELASGTMTRTIVGVGDYLAKYDIPKP
jgi:predicted thioesterase